jgi:serine/threonine protein kinase
LSKTFCPKRPETTATCHSDLAQCYEKQEKYHEAIQEYKGALTIYKQLDLKSREVATCHYNLAQCYEKQEKYREAIQEYKDALTIYKLLGLKSREVATCHYNLAQHYEKQEKYHEAIQEYKNALPIYKLLNPESREVATCHYNLANCHMILEEFSNATKSYLSALTIYEQLDPKSREVATCRLYLANCYMKLDKYNEARLANDHILVTFQQFQQFQQKYDQLLSKEQQTQIKLENMQQEHHKQITNIIQKYQERLTETQQNLNQAIQDIDNLKEQLRDERSKGQSKHAKKLDKKCQELQEQQEKLLKTQRELQEQLLKTQQELTLKELENDRLQRQLQDPQKSLKHAENENKKDERNSQSDRQLDTYSRSTNKEEASTSKPPQDGKHLVRKKDTKNSVRFEIKADGPLDSASTRDINTFHCALGEYRAIGILSDNTDYIVYLAERDISPHNEEYHHNLVFKVPQANLKECLDRLKREAKILEMFKDHPSVVTYQDFNEYGRPPFLAMDFAQGRTLLHAHLSREPLDLKLIIYYVKQLAPIVDDIHKRKVIHLDLKPENIFVKENSEPLKRKLLIGDFGCARVIESEPRQLDDSEEILGTTQYIAPEYLNAYPTYASDQYSIAVMTYEWISGHCPFNSNFLDEQVRLHDIQFQILNNSPKPLYGRKPAIPDVTPIIEKVILKGLAKDPKDRYPNATAFAEALELAYHLSLLPIPQLLSSWISFLFDSQHPQTVIAKLDKWIDYAYQPAKRVLLDSIKLPWKGWHQITKGTDSSVDARTEAQPSLSENQHSQATIFQDGKKAMTYLIGVAKYLRRIAQLNRPAKELEQIPGDTSYFEKRYAATTVQLRSGVYTIAAPFGCVIDATQMLLRDQHIYVSDEEVAKELEYDPTKGVHTKKMPEVLKDFGSKELKHDTRKGGYTQTMPAALKRLGGFVEYKYMKNADIDHLKNALKSSYAIVATIHARDEDISHVVVIDKIEEDSYGNDTFVYIRDGAHHKPYKVTIDAWNEVWNNECIIPNIKGI